MLLHYQANGCTSWFGRLHMIYSPTFPEWELAQVWLCLVLDDRDVRPSASALAYMADTKVPMSGLVAFTLPENSRLRMRDV